MRLPRLPKLRPVADVWEPLPMVRMLLPFMLGILLAEQGTLPGWFPVTVAGVCALLAWRFRSSTAGFIFLIFLGFGEAQFLRPEPSVPLNIPATYTLRITEEPVARQSREGGYAADGRITAWRDGEGNWVAAADPIRIYTDSCVTLQLGDELICRGRIRDLHPTNSEADSMASFRRRLARRGLVGMLYLHQNQIYTHNPTEFRTLHTRAVERLRRLPLSASAEEMLCAMVAGDRTRLTPELRQRFSASGLTHLLAVSGLHTGLVFLWVNILFLWMLLFRYGHVARTLLAIGSVWLFAAVAGYPASALRAAMMCTFLQLSLNSGRHYEPLNIVATAAFLLLLYNPAWIGDLGFQLSFTAVTALIVIAAPLHRITRTKNGAIHFIISSLIVCSTATFSTAPLVAHTFGSVSLTGILITPLALLPAAVIILLGSLWMVFPVAWVAGPCAFCIEQAARILNFCVECVGERGLIEWHPSGTTTLALYATLILAAFFILRIPVQKRV